LFLWRERPGSFYFVRANIISEMLAEYQAEKLESVWAFIVTVFQLQYQAEFWNLFGSLFN